MPIRGWPYPQLDELLLHEEFSRESSGSENSLRAIYGDYCDLLTVNDLSVWPRDCLKIYGQHRYGHTYAMKFEAFLRSLRSAADQQDRDHIF